MLLYPGLLRRLGRINLRSDAKGCSLGVREIDPHLEVLRTLGAKVSEGDPLVIDLPDGFRGGRLAGWYMRPQDSGTYPGVVVYHGYSGRGTRPLDLLHLAGQGMCVLSMDCRGQNGQSHDGAMYPEGHSQGWMTLGIRDPQTYYYRFVYADALRALEAVSYTHLQA